MLQKCERRLQLLSSIFFTLFFLSPLFFPCILWTTLAKGYGAPKLGSSWIWAFHCFAMDSKELSSILDCFGDQKAIKTPKLNTIWLELIARVLNMLIRLKGDKYYSKVFKRVNYKLWNNTFWVVITLLNRHIASPLAMKERKIKINSTIIYNIMLITSKNFKWHDDQTLTWNIKDIKLKLQQELSNNLPNHNS